jgi:putative selenate reductase
MSDAFTCCPIEKLIQWIFEEEKTGSIFGIHKELFFVPKASNPFRMNRYGVNLETPIGVAAGPHTQMSQNIIAAWLTGARYFELKTVQILDEIEVTKPCIKMEDVGYNCEWSQELKLEQSYREYLNAWIVIHLLKHKFGWGNPDQRGFIFNMSVGYNLEGIQSETVQRFLDKLSDCNQEKTKRVKRLEKLYPQINEIDIPDCISDNITISTMHGCPPEEIEKIGRYFIEERKLNTTIKLNPTLLGAERLRDILNTRLGYDIIVPDEAFAHDLKFDDGVQLIRNLQNSADKAGVDFSLKLTNTLETENQPGNLPEKEKMVYMSGRPLHAISVNVAAKLQEAFEGKLDLSFSAGVDCFNATRVLACNMKPVTVCTDILKPGGYTRLGQIIEELEKEIRLLKVDSLEEFVTASAGNTEDLQQAALHNLQTYARDVCEDKRYYKGEFPFDNIKTTRELPLFDCTQAPCLTACPTGQDIPSYLAYTAAGNYLEAHRVILQTNPFPNVQGKVCHHPCQAKCTRINLDGPLEIRQIKRFIAEQFSDVSALDQKPEKGIKTAIIGAGPSGLSCAYFLALEGFGVDVFEAKAAPGGMAFDAIPEFRLDQGSLDSDIRRIKSLGVSLHLNSPINREKFNDLCRNYEYVYIAIGAQKSLKLGIPGEEAEGVMDQLEFLSRVKHNDIPNLGEKIVVFGAGNSAMDAARTAKRIVGKNGEVSILYRRTRKEMPADMGEIEEAIMEGVKIHELIAPQRMITKANKIVGVECSPMKLGKPDSSGRPRPVKSDEPDLIFNADTIIPAIGQQVDMEFFPEDSLSINPETHETVLENVFSGGDAVRGAATLIEAIGDGRRTAGNIIKYAMGKSADLPQESRQKTGFSEYAEKLARRRFGLIPNSYISQDNPDFSLSSRGADEASARAEADRCLACDTYCAICTTVCPNRANLVFNMEGTKVPLQTIVIENGEALVKITGQLKIEQPLQILNIEDFCNECGNCTSFCPTNGAPYKVKPRFCLSKKSYDMERNAYYMGLNQLLGKKDGIESKLLITESNFVFENNEVKAVIQKQDFLVEQFEIKSKDRDSFELEEAVSMALLWDSLKDFYLFRQA